MAGEEVKAALTAEEWALGNLSAHGFQKEFPLYVDGVYQPQNAPKQAVFLLNLPNQPFGFTREDVQLLREVHRDMWDTPAGDMENLIARIEALLPPEEK